MTTPAAKPTSYPLINEPELQNRYRKWNLRLWNGKLPDIPIKMSSGGTSWVARTLVKVMRQPGGAAGNLARLASRVAGTPSDAVTSITMQWSNRVRLTDLQIDQTMVHEMIHVYLAKNGQPREQHGTYFNIERRRVEAMTGFPIPLTHDVASLIQGAVAPTTPRVAVVMNKPDGRKSITMINYAKFKDSAARQVADFLTRVLRGYTFDFYKSMHPLTTQMTIHNSLASAQFYLIPPHVIDEVIAQGEKMDIKPPDPGATMNANTTKPIGVNGGQTPAVP